MSIFFHEEDVPAEVKFGDGPIAVDTEAMGLIPGRDRPGRLCALYRNPCPFKLPCARNHQNQRAGPIGATGRGAFCSRTVHRLTGKMGAALVIHRWQGWQGSAKND